MIEEMEKGGKTKQAAVPFDGLRLSLTINQSAAASHVFLDG
jgi:predicted transcriptional regulator